jgi:hypothetical protein
MLPFLGERDLLGEGGRPTCLDVDIGRSTAALQSNFFDYGCKIGRVAIYYAPDVQTSSIQHLGGRFDLQMGRKIDCRNLEAQGSGLIIMLRNSHFEGNKRAIFDGSAAPTQKVAP